MQFSTVQVNLNPDSYLAFRIHVNRASFYNGIPVHSTTGTFISASRVGRPQIYVLKK